MKLSDFEKIYEANKERFIKEWQQYIQIPSISNDPGHQADCERCAQWLADHLRKIGLKAESHKTTTLPLVIAESSNQSDRKPVLFYAHYDVQPPDPIDRWSVDPFAATIQDGRLIARGALDNKGQSFPFFKAVEMLLQHNALNVPLKIVVEGEEEKGSEGLTDSLPQLGKRLAADVLLVCDTSMSYTGRPVITMGLRGIVSFEFKLVGPKRDLHSGEHGGIALNPATELARMVGNLHDAMGRVTVEGYYDEVPDPSPEDKAKANAYQFDSAHYQQEIGILPSGGEKGIPPRERLGFRPTLEVNGIHSGYAGIGSKTIIPSEAFVKLTARIVKGQDPQKVLDQVVAHFKKHAPKDLKLEVVHAAIHGPALSLSSSSPAIKKAVEVAREVFGKEEIFEWCGASIPVVASLAEVTGAQPVLVGFGLERDNMHAPDESFDLERFKRSFLYACMMLQKLGE